MKSYIFKTNLKCGGCVAALTPFMNEIKGIKKWEVDLSSPEKTLQVDTEDSLTETEITDAVNKAGYKAENI